YLACMGSISGASKGAVVSVQFVKSPVAAFVKFAWLPCATVLSSGAFSIVLSLAFSGQFTPLLLLQPIAPVMMLVVGIGFYLGAPSSHAAEQTEILGYL